MPIHAKRYNLLIMDKFNDEAYLQKKLAPRKNRGDVDAIVYKSTREFLQIWNSSNLEVIWGRRQIASPSVLINILWATSMKTTCWRPEEVATPIYETPPTSPRLLLCVVHLTIEYYPPPPTQFLPWVAPGCWEYKILAYQKSILCQGFDPLLMLIISTASPSPHTFTSLLPLLSYFQSPPLILVSSYFQYCASSSLICIIYLPSLPLQYVNFPVPPPLTISILLFPH
jgi:hypothetical protein